MQFLLGLIVLVLLLTRPRQQPPPPEPPPPPPPALPQGAPTLTGGMMHLDLEEASGATAIDLTSVGNDGQIAGATRVAAPYGRGLDFNGVGGVTVPHSTSLNLQLAGGDFTIAAWVLIRSFGQYPRLVQKGNRESGNAAFATVAYALDVTPGNGFQGSAMFPQADFRVYQSGQLHHVHSAEQIQANQWYHIAGVKVGNQLRVYVNGILAGQGPCASGPVRIINEPLNISQSPGNTDGKLDGIIDDIQIYNRAATPVDIALLAKVP